MSTGWQTLRASDHRVDQDFALALLFAPSTGRDLVADRLLLSIEAENSMQIASEPMLAAIRLQWWVEALETGRHESVPLVERLLHHIAAGRVTAEELTSQIGLWQDRLARAPEDAGGCWGAMFAILLPGQAEAAAQVGQAIVDPKAIIGEEAVHLLADRDSRWVWMLGLLARHRRQNGAMQDGTAHDDPLLVWRMLGWRIGFRRPSSATTLKDASARLA